MAGGEFLEIFPVGEPITPTMVLAAQEIPSVDPTTPGVGIPVGDLKADVLAYPVIVEVPGSAVGLDQTAAIFRNNEFPTGAVLLSLISGAAGNSQVHFGIEGDQNIARVSFDAATEELGFYIRGVPIGVVNEDEFKAIALGLSLQIPEPDPPPEGAAIKWLSNGVGTLALGAAAGDVVEMSTEGGVTTATITHVHATGVVIP